MPATKYQMYFSTRTPQGAELERRVRDKTLEKDRVINTFNNALRALEQAAGLEPGGGITYLKCAVAKTEFDIVQALWHTHPNAKYKQNHPKHWMWPYYTPEQQAAHAADKKQEEKERKEEELKEALKTQEEKRNGRDLTKNTHMLSIKLHPPQAVRINALKSEQWTTRAKILRTALEAFVKAPLITAPLELYSLPVKTEGWSTAYAHVTLWISPILRKELKIRQYQGKWPPNMQYMLRFIFDWWLDSNYPRTYLDERAYNALPHHFHQQGDETLRYNPNPGQVINSVLDDYEEHLVEKPIWFEED